MNIEMIYNNYQRKLSVIPVYIDLVFTVNLYLNILPLCNDYKYIGDNCMRSVCREQRYKVLFDSATLGHIHHLEPS